MSSRVVRKLAQRGAMLAAEHFGPKLLEKAGHRAGKALGLVPTEHRQQVQAALEATRKAAAATRDALNQRDCHGAFEAAAASRAFATVATVEAHDGGGGKAARSASLAMNIAKRAHAAVHDACEIVPKRALPPHRREAAREPEQRALPPAPVSGLRRRSRR